MSKLAENGLTRGSKNLAMKPPLSILLKYVPDEYDTANGEIWFMQDGGRS